MTSPRIAVLGTGANGATIGADLTRAGHDVTFIEQWPAHVDAMRENGVAITCQGVTTVTDVRVAHLCEVATMRGSFDVVFLVLKAYDTRWGVELIRPLIAEDGVIAGLQNGMSIDDIADIAGDDRTLGGVIELGSNMSVPGHVMRDTPPERSWFALGGLTPRAQAHAEPTAALMRAVGSAEVTEDIRAAKWMKLILNAAELVPSAILGISIVEAARIPVVRELMLEAGREALRAAALLGHQVTSIMGLPDVDPRDPERFLVSIFDLLLTEFALPSTRATVLQDWSKGRRSEVDQINGLVRDILCTSGQPAPVNAASVEIAHRIEAGAYRPSIDLLGELLELSRARFS